MSSAADANRRRSTRACDQCRRSKSKCEREGVDGENCRNCVVLGTKCTYEGPSHKRGPPKGYIHALERRLTLVENVLAVIATSPDPRASSIVADLSRDPAAAQIIQFVTRTRAVDDDEDDALSANGKAGEDDIHARLRRQSRMDRERMSFDEDAWPNLPPNWRQSLSLQLERRAGSTTAADAGVEISPSAPPIIPSFDASQYSNLYTMDEVETFSSPTGSSRRSDESTDYGDYNGQYMQQTDMGSHQRVQSPLQSPQPPPAMNGAQAPTMSETMASMLGMHVPQQPVQRNDYPNMQHWSGSGMNVNVHDTGTSSRPGEPAVLNTPTPQSPEWTIPWTSM